MCYACVCRHVYVHTCIHAGSEDSSDCCSLGTTNLVFGVKFSHWDPELTDPAGLDG